jgi:outer membrane protein, heavy metal efflux system
MQSVVGVAVIARILCRSSLVTFALASCLAVSPAPATAAGAANVPRVSVASLLTDEAKLTSWLVEHSPELRAARARVAQSSAEARQSRALPNPVLDASVANLPLGETNPAGLGLNQTAIYTVGLSQTVELGKRGPRIAGAELRQRSATHELAAAQRDERAAARYALANALYRGLRVGILQESLLDAERAAELQRTRYEQKALSGTDYDRLLLELHSLRADVARERAEYGAALAACAAVLGATCDLTGASQELLTQAAPLRAESAADARLEQRPDVQALDAESRAAQQDAELARGRAIPDLTLRLGYTHDRFVVSGDNRNTLSVGVALPLPVFDRGRYDAARSLGRAEELRDTRRAILRQARADVAALVGRKQTLETLLATLERESLPRSISVLASTQIAFDHGGVSLTDLLLSRRTQIGLRLTLLDERFELFGIRNELSRVLAVSALDPEKP